MILTSEMDDVKTRLDRIETTQTAGFASAQVYLQLWMEAAQKCAEKKK